MSQPELEQASTPGAVREELERILATPKFTASEQLTDFLRFVVEESLSHRGEAICERSIARKALLRGPDFDPKLDCIVRVVAGKLRRALKQQYAADGGQSAVRIDLPRGGYRPAFCRLDSQDQEPVATEVCRDHPPAASASEIPTLGRPVISIHPFSVFGGGEPERFLAEALAQDVSIGLSKHPWIEVVDYQATRSLVSDPGELARLMHADYFIAGTIRPVRSGYRITIQVCDAKSSVILWADLFDLPQTENHLPELDSIVKRTVAGMGDLFGALADAVWSQAKRKPSTELTAVESVLKSMRFHASLGDELYPETLKSAERAVQRNPDFAWGWAVLAHLYLHPIGFIAKPVDFNASERALECIKRAFQADPTCSYAHWSLALYYMYHNQIEKSQEAAWNAIRHSRGAPYELAASGSLLSVTGDPESGESLIKQALEINPRLPGWVHWSGAIHNVGVENYHVALTITDCFSSPGCFWDPLLRGVALARSGNHEAAQATLDEARRLRPELVDRPADVVGKAVKEKGTLEQMLECLVK